MRIALAQFNPIVGDLSGNIARIKTFAQQAKQENADLVVFPELAVCGYPPEDLLDMDDFVPACMAEVERLALECGLSLPAILIGSPWKNPEPQGKPFQNCALLLDEGKIIARQAKCLLPDYDIFDEYRYFEPGTSTQIIKWRGLQLGVLICEDAWTFPSGLDAPKHLQRREAGSLYDYDPVDELSQQNAELLICISASPFSLLQEERRLRILSQAAMHAACPLVYVNQVGAHTSLLFDGNSMILDANGQVRHLLPFFEEKLEVVNATELYSPGHYLTWPQKPETEKLYTALVVGLREYFQKNGFKSAVLGLSGGIDSALVAALAADALGPENVYGVRLPSPYSSQHSLDDAEELANNLGIHCRTIPVESLHTESLKVLNPWFGNTASGLAEENLQSRLRGLLLMAISNKEGHLLLNTTNKSEAAVGYGTLYGDMCGALSVLGDVYKLEVWEISRFVNRNGVRIPVNSIEKEPSAELKPGQRDTDSLPDYTELDPVLFALIEEQLSPQSLIRKGHDEHLVKKVAGLIRRAEYKRYQMAPVLRVHDKAFGSGRRWPLTARYSL
jgi:NAD+ synthase (glutamine-hydrolysing)